VLFVHSTGALIGLRAASGACAALIAPGTMSLLFRLFDDDELRARAISIIVVVAMIGFAIAPAASGLVITHVPWQVLLLANAPLALVAWLGVRRGIPADDPDDLRAGSADLPGAALSVTAIALGLYAFTLGVEDGWTAATTLSCAAAAIIAGIGFVLRERRASQPMLDLRLFAHPTVRGSALLQTGSMLALVGVIFASTQLFQFAWGWSPLRAGVATLPIVVGMLLAMPVADVLVRRLGHRRGAALGSALLIGALVLLAATIPVGYPPVALAMFMVAAAMRLVMVTCAVELLDALPEDHTSTGAALTDTAQELGNTVGVAVVGTIVAALVGTVLPTGAWPSAFAADFTHALQVSFVVLAAISLTIAVIGVRTLTDAKTLEEH
jgi:MFS family permease